MEKIKDSYTDNQGKVYKPILYTDAYVYMRSDFHGHIDTRMCQIKDGIVDFGRRANGFKPGWDNPEVWMKERSEAMPMQFYGQEVQRRIAEARGECVPCQTKKEGDE